MENRSFDHLLGYSKLPIDGIPDWQTIPVDPGDLTKGVLLVNGEGKDECVDDPSHDFDSITRQINGGKMDGFVKVSVDGGKDCMNTIQMFTPYSANIINSLAEEFAVLDRSFASIPTSTDPNRAMAMSGTSDGVVTNFNGTKW